MRSLQVPRPNGYSTIPRLDYMFMNYSTISTLDCQRDGVGIARKHAENSGLTASEHHGARLAQPAVGQSARVKTDETLGICGFIPDLSHPPNCPATRSGIIMRIFAACLPTAGYYTAIMADDSPNPAAQALGKLRAKSLTTEHQQAAAKALADQMTAQQRRARSAKGGLAKAAKRKAAGESA